MWNKKKKVCLVHLVKTEHSMTWTPQTCEVCVVESHRISSFIKYSKLRHLHRKSTSLGHIIQGGMICIKVPGIYFDAIVFSVLSEMSSNTELDTVYSLHFALVRTYIPLLSLIHCQRASYRFWKVEIPPFWVQEWTQLCKRGSHSFCVECSLGRP